jgi:hypothetical protein
VGEKWDWGIHELHDLLNRAVKEVSRWREVTIFVDGLDEAGPEVAAELVSYFHELTDLIPSARICISCRHYPVVTRSTGLEILVEEENRCDVQTFIYDRLEEEVPPRLEDLSFDIRLEKLGRELAGKGGDSFQWAKFVVPKVIEALKDGESFDDVTEQIASKSSELFVLYQDTLRIAVKPRNRGRTLCLFQWVCFACRPLSVTELRFALACDDEVLKPGQARCAESRNFIESYERMTMLINSLSGGLVEAKRSLAGFVVQVCHQTVNDFLLSVGFESLLAYSATRNVQPQSVLTDTEGRLLRCCLNYLKLEETRTKIQEWSEATMRELPFIERDEVLDHACPKSDYKRQFL